MNEEQLNAYVNSIGGKLIFDGIDLNGWVITSSSKSISKEAVVDKIKSQLEVISLPEQLFAENYLKFEYISSQNQIYLDARGALKCWKDDKLQPLKIKVADQWQQSRQQEIQEHQAVKLNYDWTFTTSYQGQIIPDKIQIQNDQNLSIDWDLLKAKEPILFFKDVPLYCSELDDNGICFVTAKTRVMPSCWFVLLQFWVRIDGELVRLRESRFFCKFTEPEIVIQETRWWECSFEDLKTLQGLVVDGQVVAEVDETAQALYKNGSQFETYSVTKVYNFTNLD